MENNIGSILLEAANLLLVGMVSVFLFLGLLIVCINLMSKLVGGDAPASTSVKTPSRTRNVQKNVKDDKVVAAISAAVHQYRQDHK
ncbi:oxaloacetate decarboxylase subunit gamma [Catenovulum maritimum]|jgi:oxaloacetate decarboxylase gamma subunit|uniref:Probable oxaloacetate decarboxylase gamma chain n=1 Tax=Catenovulum maritimum TaxID=1513271 RepID=A0A0J8GSE8_9ALTE|nr:oxaloacetate decarboxylase subunit gamma [Catenovulum maritimum]KMT65725.1 oxaloacetate decarboxylase subunit gamma [Catenovulum maritimum]